MKLSIPPGGRVLINGVLLQAEGKRNNFLILSRGPVVRGAMIMESDEAVTPLRQLYLTIQRAYAGTFEEQRSEPANALRFLNRLLAQDLGEERNSLLRGIEHLLAEGKYYPALLNMHHAFETGIDPVP